MPHQPQSPEELPTEVYLRILDVARGLAQTAELAPVLDLVINSMRDVLGAERASVFQYDKDAHELFATKAHGLPEDLRLPADAGIVGEAARTRAIVHIPDAYADERFNPGVDKATGFRTRDLLTVPLLDPDGELVGVAQVLNTTGERGFDGTCQRIAARLAELAAVAIKRAALLQAERDKQRYEADLKIAAMIQSAAQTREIPSYDGYEIATSFQPADETGGDAFDILDLSNIERRASADPDAHADALIFLADATGHGVGPALSSVSTLAMVRLAARLGAPLEQIILAVNEQNCEDLPVGRFITAFIGELDTQRHEIRWQSAGQAPIVRVRANGTPDESVDALNANACPMGIMPDFVPDDVEPIRLAPGDVFALLSDGYYETASPTGELFGIPRVLDLIHTNIERPAEVILGTLIDALDGFSEGAPPDDDRTGIIIRRVRDAEGAG